MKFVWPSSPFLDQCHSLCVCGQFGGQWDVLSCSAVRHAGVVADYGCMLALMLYLSIGNNYHHVVIMLRFALPLIEFLI